MLYLYKSATFFNDKTIRKKGLIHVVLALFLSVILLLNADDTIAMPLDIKHNVKGLELEFIMNAIDGRTIDEVHIKLINNIFVNPENLVLLARRCRVRSYDLACFRSLRVDIVNATLSKIFLIDYFSFNVKKVIAQAKKSISKGKGGGGLAWALSDLLIGCIYSFQLTGDKAFLDIALYAIREELNLRDTELDETRNRIMKGWGFPYGKNKIWQTEITYQGLISLPILLFSKEVLDGNIKDYKKYVLEFVPIIGSILEQYLDEMILTQEGGFFLSKASGTMEAMNHQAAFAHAALIYYSISKNKKFQLVAKETINFLVNNWAEDDKGRVSWPYSFTKYDKPIDLDYSKRTMNYRMRPTLTWKGGITIDFLYSAWKQGLFPDVEFDKLIKTFNGSVYRGNLDFNIWVSSKRFKSYNNFFLYKSNKQSGARLAQWIFLGEREPKVIDIISKAVSMRLDLFPHGWASSSVTMRAYVFKELHSK